MKVLMLPDAGPGIGLGHVSRLISLAQAFEARRASVDFALRDPKARAFVKEHGFSARSAWSQADLAVIDSYRFSKSDLSRLKRLAPRTAYIDDRGLSGSSFDAVIAPSPLPARRTPRYAGGSTYVPLRKEYWINPPHPTRPQIRRVFISLGAIPNAGMLRRIVSLVLDTLPQARLFVAGPSQLARWPRVQALKRQRSLKPCFHVIDAAISAGGQTLLELLASGVPTLALEIASNQRRNIQGAVRAGAAISIGRSASRRWPARLARELRALSNAPRLRKSLSWRAQKLITGKGAARACQFLSGVAS